MGTIVSPNKILLICVWSLGFRVKAWYATSSIHVYACMYIYTQKETDRVSFWVQLDTGGCLSPVFEHSSYSVLYHGQ